MSLLGKPAITTEPPICSATSRIDALPEGYSTSSTMTLNTLPSYNRVRLMSFSFIRNEHHSLRKRDPDPLRREQPVGLFSHPGFNRPFLRQIGIGGKPDPNPGLSEIHKHNFRPRAL